MDRREAVVGEAELLRAENFHLKRRVRSLEAEVEQLRQAAMAALGKRQKRTERAEERNEAERTASELREELAALLAEDGHGDVGEEREREAEGGVDEGGDSARASSATREGGGEGGRAAGTSSRVRVR